MARRSQSSTKSFAWTGFIFGVLLVVLVCAFLNGGSQPSLESLREPEAKITAGGDTTFRIKNIEELSLKNPMDAKGLEVIEVESYDKFHETMKKLEDKPDLFVLFLADTNPETGVSWCPDTARADPVIMGVFKNLNKDTTLVRVYVGDRPTWKSPNNPYRTDSKIAISSVPTFMRWKDGPVEGSVLGDSESYMVDLLLRIVG